jgi:type I restriction enzyme M protein
LAEFVKLQKEKADSDNSWSIAVKDLDTSTYDISVRNPNRDDEVVLRDPKDILAEIQKNDKEVAKVLKEIEGLL